MGEATGRFTSHERSLSIGALRALNVFLCRIYHRVEVHTPCRLPRSGACILVCNHLSALDPVLIQAVSPRLIRWMMAREYYQQPALKWIFDAIGIIPVERSGRDMAATRSALAALRDGYVLGVFPEGKIETTRQLLPFQAGIALLAQRSGAPIYPTYIEGTQRGKGMLEAYFVRQGASLNFGAPFSFPASSGERRSFSQLTDEVWKSVDFLRQMEMRRLNNQHPKPD